MSKKNIISMVVVAIVVAGGGFYGGMVYAQTPKALAKLSPAKIQAAFAAGRGTGTGTNGTGRTGGAFTGNFGGRGGTAGANGGFVNGQIIAKDANSITIQLPNNMGTKIVLLAESSQITKADAGTASDLATGQTVTVTGSANSDGSVTAQTISIRPANATPPPNSSNSTTQAQ